ncbi:hypothetical protein [Sphingomonas koreensis]|uniref:hypothetical protein n=1 Tax=Sphingomonas koreensis TaxID=93064 RepID=UPI000A58C266|nr:hypothetical protein [Sphingomonas koreensis]
MRAAPRIHSQDCPCSRCRYPHIDRRFAARRSPSWALQWLLGSLTGCAIILAIGAAGGPSPLVLIGGAP